LKKRTKKLLIIGVGGGFGAHLNWQKFLLLFSKRSASFIAGALTFPAPRAGPFLSRQER
jgi:hypothetical protein